MKSFALTLGAIATLVAAQDISSLPECGRFCATDMLTGKADGLGCDANDLSCLCQSRDFTYGLRDCSAATCGADDARRIVEYGLQICRDAGVEITTGAGGEPTITGTNGGDASGSVSTIFTTISSDDETITTPVATTTLEGSSTGSGSGSGTVTVTSPSGTVTSEASDVVSTLTTDGSTITTTLSTASDDLVSTFTTDGSTITTTFSTAASGTDSEGGDSTGTDGAASSTNTDDAANPQRTIAPVGIVVAGLAALLL